MSIITNIINIYIAPSKVFEAVKDFKWKNAGIPLIILAIVGALSFWAIKDLATEIGYQTTVERIENSTKISDEQKTEIYERIEKQMSGPQVSGWIFSFLGGPIGVLFMTIIALLIGNTFLGGSAKYSQLLNVTAWTYMINILESIIKIPLMLSKWSLDVFTGLGVLGIGEKGTFINSLLAGIDIFAIWRIMLIAIGMGIIYNKKTKPYAIAMFGMWFILKLISAAFSSFSGGLLG